MEIREATTHEPNTSKLPWEGLRASGRYLPLFALLVRVSVGVGLLNGSLFNLLGRSSGGGAALGLGGGPSGPAFFGVGEAIELLPYVELAVGLALIAGIFTTVAALAACVLNLIIPVMMTYTLMLGNLVGTTPNMTMTSMLQFGQTGFFHQSRTYLDGSPMTLSCLLLLVVLSQPSINRYSIDALIFRPFKPRPTSMRAPDRLKEGREPV